MTSITGWIVRLRDGDDKAVAPLLDRYLIRLTEQARRHLSRQAFRSAALDGEDVALEAFEAFRRGLAGKRYPDLDSRNEAWAMLSRIVKNIARKTVEAERTQKRGEGKSINDLALESFEDDEPTAEEVVEAADQFHSFLSILPSKLRRYLNDRAEGYSYKEIADRLKVSVPTVERKFELIRTCWEEIS